MVSHFLLPTRKSSANCDRRPHGGSKCTSKTKQFAALFLYMSVSWEYFQANYFSFPQIGLAVDLSRLKIPPNRWEVFSSQFSSIHKAMSELEAGAIANG